MDSARRFQLWVHEASLTCDSLASPRLASCSSLSIGVEKKVEGRHVERTQQDQSLFHLKELNSAKVGNPLYLNNSHVVRAKPLYSSLHQKRSPSLKKYPFLCQLHFVFLNDLTINVLLFHPRVV